MRKTGFTLVEVLVASVIGVFVALVAVGTLKFVSVSAEMVDDNIETAAEVRYASKRIATDLLNLYRDENARNTKLVGTVEETGAGGVTCLTFYTVGRTKARVGQPEGDIYEVEYYLLQDEERSVLMRRLWPNPDEDATPRGILTAIAEDIDVFVVRFFDGRDWQMEWPEELESLPELVEVRIEAKRRGRADGAVESFVVNFARFGGGQAEAFEGSGHEESGGEGEKGKEEKEKEEKKEEKKE